MRGGFENFVGLRGVREFVVGVEDSARSLGSDDVTVLCIECDKDNFHMIFKAKSTLNIPKYLNAIKTITSREIKRKFPEVKKKLWKSMFWSRSYFLATTGQVTLDVLLKGVVVPYRDKEKLFLVLGLLFAGRVSFGKAAELLGLRVDEFWDLLDELGVKFSYYDREEVEKELEAYRKVFSGF